jgi:hypothetical protein
MTYWEPTCKDDLPLKNNPAIKLGFWEWSLNESQKDLGTIFCSVCCETAPPLKISDAPFK